MVGRDGHAAHHRRLQLAVLNAGAGIHRGIDANARRKETAMSRAGLYLENVG
jgi:hypothetical protein